MNHTDPTDQIRYIIDDAEGDKLSRIAAVLGFADHNITASAAAQGEVEREAFEKMLELARRTLWIAYVWNDHNFEAAHIEARKTARQNGIDNLEQANKWLSEMPNKIDRAALPTAQQAVFATPELAIDEALATAQQARQEQDQWHEAVLVECMKVESCYVANDPAKTLANLIDWHVKAAEDLQPVQQDKEKS